MLDDASAGTASPAEAHGDSQLYDAYSSAVMSAVDRAGPAVVHIGVRKGEEHRWSGARPLLRGVSGLP